MEYREFVCAAIETMNQKEGKNGIQAREHRAVKNNGKIRVGLLLQETGSNLFPTIYLEEYYEKFQKRGNSGTDCVGDQPALSKDQGKKYHRCGFFFLIWNHGRISWGSK